MLMIENTLLNLNSIILLYSKRLHFYDSMFCFQLNLSACLPTEVVKVFDGNSSLRRRMFRIISVPRTANTTEFLTIALRAFHIPRESRDCYLSDAYSAEEIEIQDPLPVAKLTRRDGKRPAVFLRFR